MEKCLSCASVLASALERGKSASSADRPFARDLAQIRRTETADHGKAACVTHLRAGAGNSSKASMGLPERFLRRRRLSPRL